MRSALLLLALPWGTASFAPTPSAFLPAQYLPIYGGSGGSGFTRTCGSGKVLTGLTVRSGLALDAVGLLCRPLNPDGTLGSESTVGSLAGGGGGTSVSESCARGSVVAGARIYHGSLVNGIYLICKSWFAGSRSFLQTMTEGAQVGRSTGTSSVESCEARTQPANGIRGRASMLVDAIGFICDEP